MRGRHGGHGSGVQRCGGGAQVQISISDRLLDTCGTNFWDLDDCTNFLSIALICRPNQMSLNLVVRVRSFFSLPGYV